MSIASLMEKLLNGVEVNWKALGELGELVRGNGLPKPILLSQEYQLFTTGRFTLITDSQPKRLYLLFHLKQPRS